jgi:hypothetical protein
MLILMLSISGLPTCLPVDYSSCTPSIVVLLLDEDLLRLPVVELSYSEYLVDDTWYIVGVGVVCRSADAASKEPK